MFHVREKSYAVKETQCIPTYFARTFLQKIKWIEYLEKTKFLVDNIDRGIVKIMYVVLRLIRFIVFNATFSYIMATRYSGGGSRSTRREPPTMGKQLVNFITCGCESSALFCNLQSLT